jgi:hypothetical protein
VDSKAKTYALQGIARFEAAPRLCQDPTLPFGECIGVSDGKSVNSLLVPSSSEISGV